MKMAPSLITFTLTALAAVAFAAGQCPAEDEPENDILLPNPSNCSTYFQCHAGQLVLMPCPPGLHFNALVSQCDFPVEEGCASLELQPHPLEIAPKESVCPPPGEGNLVLLPNPQNCSQYLACDNGKLVVRDCPPGLHFNAESHVCEFPWSANCQESLPPMVPPVFPPRPRHQQTHLPSMKAICPPPGNGDLVLFPNPQNCSEYFACDNGISVLRECPPGLHFNHESKVCDFPWAAGCQISKRPEESRRLPLKHLPAKAPVCPPPGEGDLVLFPQPGNCSQYLACDNGNLTVRECPPGLHFNPELLVCDFPGVTGCEKRPDAAQEPQCRPPGEGNLQIFPHPNDCSLYLVCDNGLLVTMECPEGLHFNEKKGVCDFPSSAGCEKIYAYRPFLTQILRRLRLSKERRHP